MEQVHFKPFPSPMIYVEVAQKWCGNWFIMGYVGRSWVEPVHFKPFDIC